VLAGPDFIVVGTGNVDAQHLDIEAGNPYRYPPLVVFSYCRIDHLEGDFGGDEDAVGAARRAWASDVVEADAFQAAAQAPNMVARDLGQRDDGGA
jgi:hypothetical protein